MFRGRPQNMVHVRLLRVPGTNRFRPVRQPFRAGHQLYKNFDPRIKAMHMRRQMVMRVREKPHAVKRLRAHTLTLVLCTESDKENRNASPTP